MWTAVLQQNMTVWQINLLSTGYLKTERHKPNGVSCEEIRLFKSGILGILKLTLNQ